MGEHQALPVSNAEISNAVSALETFVWILK